ncbi:MAG: DeoR/GlpR family DNA-binding transcription regulator [Acidimicrobiia bacterium]|nr:DeoR/GlpR family DNA-binding transcription regulator [Acidimicrobiia bacterium]
MAKRGRPSLARQRHALIVSHVRRHGSARVTELADRLDVSEMTIRRDLDILAENGLIEKIHGGATVRFERATDEPGFEVKASHNTNEKRAIAATAAMLTGAGAAIGLTAGTTTAQLANELVTVPDLTVVTNSVPVSDVFHFQPRADRKVILIGGERTPSDALVGAIAVRNLSSFHLDMVFMGVHGMHEQAGYTTPNLLEAETNRAFVRSTDQVVVLADHTKWGVAGLASFAELEDAAVCVTDAGISSSARSVLTDRVGRLLIGTPDRSSEGR